MTMSTGETRAVRAARRQGIPPDCVLPRGTILEVRGPRATGRGRLDYGARALERTIDLSGRRAAEVPDDYEVCHHGGSVEIYLPWPLCARDLPGHTLDD